LTEETARHIVLLIFVRPLKPTLEIPMKKTLLLAVLGGMLLSACAGPRIVSSIQVVDSKFRLMFFRNLGSGRSEQGLIDCAQQADGTLSDCKPLKIVFAGDQQ
jgi:hypothetical protein